MKRVTLELVADLMERAIAGQLFTDYKSKLQELAQKRSEWGTINYEVEWEEGPDHDKTFYVVVKARDLVLGRGIGKSKKEAEKDAARNVLSMEE